MLCLSKGRFVFGRAFSTSAVGASLVKELREKSGAPMMDCKKALAANAGDVSKAMDWLRAKGIARAASSADRAALEGLVALHIRTSSVTLVEVNSETDFVSRNKDFQEFCALVATTAAATGVSDVQALLATKSATGTGTIKDALGDVVNVIRENIVIRRVASFPVAAGSVVAGYVHGKVVFGGTGPGSAADGGLQLGKSAAIVSLRPSKSPGPVLTAPAVAALETAARRLAMHVVAAKPLYLSELSVPVDVMTKETDICRQQLDAANQLAGKKPEVADKIVRGKVLKRLSELCLLSQPHVAEEGAPVVSKFLAALALETAGSGATCTGFERWTVGAQ